MNEACAAAREWLLEAELAELRSGTGVHAEHVRSCTACSAVARTIVQGYGDLDAALNALAKRKVLPFRKKKLLWAPLPLAAAAVLALMLTRTEKTPPPPSPLLAQLMVPEKPVVSPPAGKQAVVLEKNDLTVVWLY